MSEENDTTSGSEILDELLGRLDIATKAMGEWDLRAVNTSCPIEWAARWRAIPPDRRAAVAQEIVTFALRSAHQFVDSANAAHAYHLDARTKRLDDSASALCLLAGLVLKLARDADAEDDR